MANFNKCDGNIKDFSVGGNYKVISEEGKQSNIDIEEQKVVEQRRTALRAILEPAAVERLNRIALVKPDKVIQIEDYILRTARTYGFSQHRKLHEEELISMLSRINESCERDSKITIYRRGVFDEDDEVDF